jgi:hypothetical protein
MAFIRGPFAGRADLDGTTGDDIIIAFGSHNDIADPGGSNWVVTSSGGHDTITLGMVGDGHSTWTDDILLTGAGNTLTGGDERFTIASLRGGNDITIGNGDNHLYLLGTGNTVRIGHGENEVSFGGGHASLVQVGVFTTSTTATTVHFSGTGNSFSVGSDSPVTTILPYANTVITGGDGDGTFSFGSGTKSLHTDGLHNVVYTGIGNFDIAPGDGYDTVHLGASARSGGSTGTVTLEGTHNTIDGTAYGLTVKGGDGYTTINTGGAFSNGIFDIVLGGSHNSIAHANTAATGTIDTGSGDASVSLYGNSATLTFRGADNVATLRSADGGTIIDQSDHLLVNVTGSPGYFFFHETIQNFGASRGGVIALDDAVTGYTSAAQAVEALHASGGDTVLDLPNAGELVFAGLNPSALHDYNFTIV